MRQELDAVFAGAGPSPVTSGHRITGKCRLKADNSATPSSKASAETSAKGHESPVASPPRRRRTVASVQQDNKEKEGEAESSQQDKHDKEGQAVSSQGSPKAPVAGNKC